MKTETIFLWGLLIGLANWIVLLFVALYKVMLEGGGEVPYWGNLWFYIAIVWVISCGFGFIFFVNSISFLILQISVVNFINTELNKTINTTNPIRIIQHIN